MAGGGGCCSSWAHPRFHSGLCRGCPLGLGLASSSDKHRHLGTCLTHRGPGILQGVYRQP